MKIRKCCEMFGILSLVIGLRFLRRTERKSSRFDPYRAVRPNPSIEELRGPRTLQTRDHDAFRVLKTPRVSAKIRKCCEIFEILSLVADPRFFQRTEPSCEENERVQHLTPIELLDPTLRSMTNPFFKDQKCSKSETTMHLESLRHL